jgi:hypothetical protein
VILPETTFPIVIPKFISLPFPLFLGYLDKLVVFEVWTKGGAVEVDEHDAAALVIPKLVGLALVAMVDALGPDGLRRTPHFRR